MIQKNSKYKTDGNSMIDKILGITEHSIVLSDVFKSKLDGIALTILTNHANQIDWINEAIQNLRDDMSRLSIFKESFLTEIVYCLEAGLRYEIKVKEINDMKSESQKNNE